MVTKSINVTGTDISVDLRPDASDYINLTDMARMREDTPTDQIVQNWLRDRYTIEYLGTWEQLHNPAFDGQAWNQLQNDSWHHAFTLNPKQWVEHTKAIGIKQKGGRYGGTYGHKDIAFHFAMWLSPTFQLYVAKEYGRLCQSERGPQLPTDDSARLLSKLNDSDIDKHILTALSLNDQQARLANASEADALNLAVFGCSAKDWAEAHPELAKTHNLRAQTSLNERRFRRLTEKP